MDAKASMTPDHSAQPADGVEALLALRDRFPEINPSNYNDDDVAALNAWGCEVHAAIDTLAASKADSAQGDWVLVPRVATNAMREAGRSAHSEAEERAPAEAGAGKAGMYLRANRAAHVYAAMLAAAPTPQPEGGRGEAVRDWTEDASHENGDYQCRCVTCGNIFVGHKRRVVCKACATPTDAARVRDAWLPIASLGTHEGNVVIADKRRSALMRASWVRILVRAAVEDGETFWATSWLPAPALAAVEGEG